MKEVTLSKTALLASNVVLLVALTVVLVALSSSKKIDEGSIKRDSSGQYLFTNPILDYENLNSGEESVIQIGLINKRVDELKDSSDITHISLYYRDLNNGQWIGIEEKEEFYPASLLKVPTMMAFLKSIESEAEVLNMKQFIKPRDDYKVQQNISFDGTVVVGQEYSFLEILHSMITKSDNIAAQTILSNTNPKEVENVFSAVGVPFVDTKTEPVLRVKDYAGFFRVLYNSTYLNREMSELALKILSDSEYKDGLVAGIPSNILVAHKFGERSVVDNSSGEAVVEQTQIHDCGIVYYPKMPYILCIMTRGDDFGAQEKAIQELSRFVYVEISK